MSKTGHLAFIGLGVMGQPMAGHLISAGHALKVHTRTKSKARALTGKGATWSATPAEAADGADVVFICVPDTPDVEKVLLGADGVLQTVKKGAIVVDHSTISPSATRRFAKELATKGAKLLDAPISGGDVGARNGTLSIMVGGDNVAYKKVEPLLRHMGTTITYCGPSGNGQLTKLVNQVLVTVTNLAVCEALVFGKRNGLDLERTIAALAAGAAGSWQLSNLGPRMIKHDLKPGFTIDLQQKDLKIVLQTAEESNTSLPAASLVHQLFTAAQAAGHGKDGTQALYCVLEKLASLH
ncbi:MAG: 3-hydroxyisobutyrate dehydrogenase [Humisphaera sp.]|nr:3-hydroxyisobutyrate dehydrogenase [Humisphaera sp.]